MHCIAGPNTSDCETSPRWQLKALELPHRTANTHPLRTGRRRAARAAVPRVCYAAPPPAQSSRPLWQPVCGRSHVGSANSDGEQIYGREGAGRTEYVRVWASEKSDRLRLASARDNSVRASCNMHGRRRREGRRDTSPSVKNLGGAFPQFREWSGPNSVPFPIFRVFWR